MTHATLISANIRNMHALPMNHQKQVGSTLSRKAKKKLLEPGYWGSLEDEELEFIQKALENNPKLSYAWGFQPVQKSRAPDAIRRVAMWGDPEDREVNTKVIRRSRARSRL